MSALNAVTWLSTEQSSGRFPADRYLEEIEDIAQLAVTRGWHGLKQCIFGSPAFAPVHRLSRELLNIIFLLCHPESSSGRWSQGEFVRPSPRTVPLVLTHVCKAWREVAISIPELWSSIDVHLSNKVPRSVALRSVDFVDTWLRRSGNLPLSLSITVNEYPYDAIPVLALYFSYVPRWQHIRCQIESDKILRDSPPFIVHPGVAASLETLEVSTRGIISENLSIPFNRIMTVAPRLRQCSFTRLAPYYALAHRSISLPISQLTHLCLEDFESVEHCLEVLRDSRKLIDCRLNLGRLFECSTGIQKHSVVRLDELRSLQICTRSGLPDFLDHLILPALRDITIHFERNSSRYKSDTAWPQSQFTSLICRSSCSLTKLHFKSVPLSEKNLLQCLRHTTLSLRELHIEDKNPLTCVTDVVLKRLSHGSSGRGRHASLCPRLDTFRFSRCGSFTMDAFTNMLESRMSNANRSPSPLRCVRPRIVEVAMITWADRLEVLRIQGLQLKIAVIPS
jgi:hypothetical protein